MANKEKRRTARLEIVLFPEQRNTWERTALENGFTSTSDYVRATVEQDIKRKAGQK